MLDMTKQGAARVVDRPDFPRPVDVLWAGKLPLWPREAVQRWIAERRAKTG